MLNVQNLLTGESSLVKQFVFNDGSVQVEITDPVIDQDTGPVLIEAILQTPADQMALVMLVNAIRHMSPMSEINLYLPFCPYSRQDYVFLPGQPNAMQAWAGLINSLNFRTVNIVDPHSIASEMINNCIVTSALEALQNFGTFIDPVSMTLVSPDAGANKKCHKIAQTFGFSKLIRADKARDLATGNIIETEIYGDVDGETCLIIDDICDGGMTFIKLAEALKERGAKSVILYVTHGLFTKGLRVFEGLIDEVYTTNTWIRPDGVADGYSGKFEVIC